jgi:hypothetical protein
MSLLAILAICVAGGFGIVVLTLTGVGMVTRRPVLEPLLILLAVVGVVLAVAARWQIKNAEGTIAGTGLAKTAFWLSIVVGCCYLAYFYGNAFAIQQQAKEFVRTGFFGPLQQRDYKQLALVSLPPQARRGMSKDDVAVRFAPTLNALQHIEFIRVMDRAGKDSTVESQGIKEWKETPDGVEVALNYLVKTREGEFEIIVTAVGAENKDTTGRQWFVRSGAPFVKSKKFTSFGRMFVELQFDGERFLKDWLAVKLPYAHFDQLYLDTLPISADERQRLHADYVRQGIIGNGLACGATPGGGLDVAASLALLFGNMELNRQVYLPARGGSPGYDGYARRLVRFDERTQAQPTTIKEQLIPRLLQASVLAIPSNANFMESMTILEWDPTQVRVYVPVEFNLPAPLNYRANGRVVAICEDKDVLAKLSELGAAPWSGDQPFKADTSNSVLGGLSHQWRIGLVELDFARRSEANVGSLPALEHQFQPPDSTRPKQ